MINLDPKYIKKFLAQSAAIKPNILYPALDVIKIQTGGKKVRLTKTNMNVFVQNTFEQDFDNGKQTVLVNEQALNAFVSLYNDAFVQVDYDDKNVTLIGDDNRRQVLPYEDPATYPTTPTAPKTEGSILHPSDIAAIKVAAKFMNTDGIETVFHFVHLGARGIFASNQSYIYHYATESNLPEVLLGEFACVILAGMPGGAVVRTADRYDFFEDGSLLYAVVKTEFKSFDYTKIISMTSANMFTVKRVDVVNFCSLVESSCKQEWPLATFAQADGGKLKFEYIDGDFGRHANALILVASNFKVPAFKISVKRLNAAFKAIPYETISLTPINEHYKITSPEDAAYAGMVSGLHMQ